MRRRECMNSSACWPCRHGEHCWTVKAWVWYRLRSGLIFVSGRRDQQKDSLRVQLCHNSSDSCSLAYSSALLQAQLDLQPCFPPITTHFHSSGLLSAWKDEPMWKKIEIHTAFPHVAQLKEIRLTKARTLIVYSPVQSHNPCFKNEWTPCKQKAICSVVMFASSWWQHSQCVTGIQTSYSVSPFLGNDLFLKLKLATECHSLFFNVFIAAGKVSLPHMKRTSNLHDLFLILCSQNVLHWWNFECFEWSIFGLTWSTYRCCLLPVSCTCPLLFFFFCTCPDQHVCLFVCTVKTCFSKTPFFYFYFCQQTKQMYLMNI